MMCEGVYQNDGKGGEPPCSCFDKPVLSLSKGSARTENPHFSTRPVCPEPVEGRMRVFPRKKESPLLIRYRGLLLAHFFHRGLHRQCTRERIANSC